MDDEHLFRLIQKYRGSLNLSAESFIALMRAAREVRRDTLTAESGSTTVAPRPKIGRPRGAKDKKPRKRRSEEQAT
jgi:hypothetical protein